MIINKSSATNTNNKDKQSTNRDTERRILDNSDITFQKKDSWEGQTITDEFAAKYAVIAFKCVNSSTRVK